MRRALTLFVALLPAAAWPQGDPLGPEFRVNTYTTSLQFAASASADSSGNFVVVWYSLQDGSGSGIFGQRYADSGAPLGPEFRVNTYTTLPQLDPALAVDGAGNFLVAWTSQSQDGSSTGVFAQRYGSSGAPMGPEFRVNTDTAGPQTAPAVASAATGGFVVAWMSFDGSLYGIFGRRFADTGAPLGPEFRVNAYTPGYHHDPSVAAAATGDFVVVWSSDGQDGSDDGVFGQRFAASGVPLGPEFRVNSYTAGHQSAPAVALADSSGFVVVWQSFLQDGSGYGVYAQRFADSGAPLGTEFRVNAFTSLNQNKPRVALDTAGNFVVVWESYNQDGSTAGGGIFAQRYAASGGPLGPQFRVNTYTTSNQRAPSAAADPLGSFVVVWSSIGQDGNDYGVFGQRFGRIVPVELMQFGIK
jgi:hypothetical protein